MRNRARLVVLVGWLVVLLTAGSGCSDPQAPGYVAVQDGKLTAVRPAAWSTELTVDSPWTSGFQPASKSIEQIQFSGDFGDFATAGAAVGTLIGQAQLKLPDFTVVETRDIDVPGATTGQIVRYTITDNAKSQLSGEWIVAAHWPYPQSIAVSILTPRYDQELERQVLDALKMRPSLS